MINLTVSNIAAHAVTVAWLYQQYYIGFWNSLLTHVGGFFCVFVYIVYNYENYYSATAEGKVELQNMKQELNWFFHMMLQKTQHFLLALGGIVGASDRSHILNIVAIFFHLLSRASFFSGVLDSFISLIDLFIEPEPVGRTE